MKLWVLILLGIGHLATDVHQGAIPLMLPYLQDSLSLSYLQIGAIVLVANLSSSIIQPLFGLYSDKVNIPWLLPIGISLAALGVALIGLMPSYPMVLMAVFLSGIGVAAYHPEGSKLAHFAAGSKRGSAMSIFSVGGNLGFGLGPLLGSLYLGLWGLTGSVAFLGPGLIIAAVVYFLLPKIMGATSEARESWQEKREYNKVNGTGKPVWSWGIMLLMSVVVIRSWIQFGLVSFIPLYYKDVLGDARFGEILISVFLIAGAVGTVFGGPLADKFGSKKLISFSMLLMFPLIYLFLKTNGLVSMAVLGMMGMVLISTFAPSVVMGQSYMPHNIGLASGLMIGFAIGAGGLGAPFLGYIADSYGLPLAMNIIAMLPLLGLGLALFLPAPPELKETQKIEAVVTPAHKA